MTNYLKDKIDSLFKMGNDFVNYEGLRVTFYKNNAATKDEIDTSFSGSQLVIPKDYIDFLQLLDGCTVFQFQDLGGFEFLGTKNILRENDIQRETYEEEWNNNLTVFCRILGEGDFISFKVYDENKYEILDCYHDDDPQNWKVISNSFDNFLERLIDEKGKCYWLENDDSYHQNKL